MKTFNQFINEGIRDKMKPKSTEELDSALENLLSKLKESSEDKTNDYIAEELRFMLENIYGDRKQMIYDLMEEGIDPDDLSVMITDDLLKASSERELNYRLLVQKFMYNLIEKNKDKINMDYLHHIS